MRCRCPSSYCGIARGQRMTSPKSGSPLAAVSRASSRRVIEAGLRPARRPTPGSADPEERRKQNRADVRPMLEHAARKQRSQHLRPLDRRREKSESIERMRHLGAPVCADHHGNRGIRNRRQRIRRLRRHRPHQFRRRVGRNRQDHNARAAARPAARCLDFQPERAVRLTRQAGGSYVDIETRQRRGQRIGQGLHAIAEREARCRVLALFRSTCRLSRAPRSAPPSRLP